VRGIIVYLKGEKMAVEFPADESDDFGLSAFNAQQVAKFFHCDEQTVHNHMASGKLPYFVFGKRKLVKLSTLKHLTEKAG
jgi:hypothetical protein